MSVLFGRRILPHVSELGGDAVVAGIAVVAGNVIAGNVVVGIAVLSAVMVFDLLLACLWLVMIGNSLMLWVMWLVVLVGCNN